VDQEDRRDHLVNYWENLEHHSDEQIWMAHPLVRRAINERVSGDPNMWPVTALRVRLGRTAGTSLSIGCGTGGLERSIVDENISGHVTGIDISEAPLAEARRLAGDRPITYLVADAWSFLRENSFDAILFHGSLHHFDRLDELMALVARALKPNGFLWYDEYVGPSRDEWGWRELLRLNIAYYRLPAAMRRPHIVRAPINREDPTEAIASSQIVAATERRFRIIDRRDYGGNLLSVIYPNLRRAPEFDRWIERLIEWDGAAMRRRPSYSTVILAEPR
jgi:SAM-dependent methyltransferase